MVIDGEVHLAFPDEVTIEALWHGLLKTELSVHLDASSHGISVDSVSSTLKVDLFEDRIGDTLNDFVKNVLLEAEHDLMADLGAGHVCQERTIDVREESIEADGIDANLVPDLAQVLEQFHSVHWQ